MLLFTLWWTNCAITQVKDQALALCFFLNDNVSADINSDTDLSAILISTDNISVLALDSMLRDLLLSVAGSLLIVLVHQK